MGMMNGDYRLMMFNWNGNWKGTDGLLEQLGADQAPAQSLEAATACDLNGPIY
jgi:hypothetical protein